MLVAVRTALQRLTKARTLVVRECQGLELQILPHGRMSALD